MEIIKKNYMVKDGVQEDNVVQMEFVMILNKRWEHVQLIVQEQVVEEVDNMVNNMEHQNKIHML